MRQNAKQVFVPVVVGYGILNNINIDSNAITSAYGKKYSLSKWLKEAMENEANGKAFSLYYLNVKKATSLLQAARVPMPKVPATRNDGFIHSIAETGSPVKPKYDNVTQSTQFKRWFGDWENKPQGASKVVNADGTPKVVYHGTNADFSEFNGGAFFTDDYFNADGYASGERIIEAYLNIKRPLVIDCNGANYTKDDLYGLRNVLRDFSTTYFKQKGE